ncbi:hypothetical protein LPJ66_010493 [Kickxella alabastrina]|uniref:Uncharacterized protein n=1 Tax=Kickxella alabastrina TaxID=61397 RepID=A0ACC1I4H0_9FUNG|nr:hypothetical protein LPJ66_010493 [Kickxella alabastrina]
MSKLATEILTKTLPPTVTFASKPKTLYELLNVQRLNAFKFKTTPEHWYQKGFDQCYYEIHKVKYKQYKNEPTHGKAWGILFWNGKPVNEKPKEIRGGLKFSWRRYESPHANGIKYDAQKAMNMERRRTHLVRDFVASTNATKAE